MAAAAARCARGLRLPRAGECQRCRAPHRPARDPHGTAATQRARPVRAALPRPGTRSTPGSVRGELAPQPLERSARKMFWGRGNDRVSASLLLRELGVGAQGARDVAPGLSLPCELKVWVPFAVSWVTVTFRP